LENIQLVSLEKVESICAATRSTAVHGPRSIQFFYYCRCW